MAKKTSSISIDKKIRELKAIQDVLEYIDTRIEATERTANDYLEMCKDEEESTEEQTVYDTSNWNYERYEDYLADKEAFEELKSSIEALA